MSGRIYPVGLKGNQITERMKELMGIQPINENRTTSVVELTKMGPDGKIYAIVRENHEYYIKIADKKSNLTVEDFKYIGGLQNKKQEAYPSYARATKHLNLKFNSLNEALGKSGNINVLQNDHLVEDWAGFSSLGGDRPMFKNEGNLEGHAVCECGGQIMEGHCMECGAPYGGMEEHIKGADHDEMRPVGHIPGMEEHIKGADHDEMRPVGHIPGMEEHWEEEGYMDEAKAKNPWAICTASVGRDDKEKYERCVMDVKKSMGMHESMTEEEYMMGEDSEDEMLSPELEAVQHMMDEMSPEEYSPKQKKLAALGGDPDKIDADDFAALRHGKRMHERLSIAKSIHDMDDIIENVFESLKKKAAKK
jgi:hypothetical protein